ncbi:MAG TPA: hypothetical protein VIV57_01745 [Anaeromyxobacter sp.]
MLATALLALVLGAPATSTAGLGDSFAAALEVLRGRPARARVLLAPAGRIPDDPAALLVLSCAALDAGDLAEAGRLAGRLRSLRPDAVEGQLLVALLAERRARPRGDWIAQAMSALARVSSPLDGLPLLDVDGTQLAHWQRREPDALPDVAGAKLGAADAFLVGWAWTTRLGDGADPALRKAALRLAGSDERLLVQLAVLDVLEPGAAANPMTPDVERARRAALDRIAREPLGRLRALALRSGPERAPLSDEEVAGFEAAVVGLDGPLLARFYEELLPIFERADPVLGTDAAWNAAVRFALSGWMSANGLAERVPDSTEGRERLAAAWVRYADVLGREGILLFDMLGAVALYRAGALLRDSSLSGRSDIVRRRSEELRATAMCVPVVVARLPLRSLRQAWARERVRERQLAEQGAHLGLSCPDPLKRPSGRE